MITGTWLTRKGENFQITNIPGGQKIEWENTPPVQGQMHKYLHLCLIIWSY